jgi:hypothetical protein
MAQNPLARLQRYPHLSIGAGVFPSPGRSCNRANRKGLTDRNKQLADDGEILDFLIRYVEKFDMYVEDEYAAFVRYCFADPLDAEIFRSRFEPKAERFRLAG